MHVAYANNIITETKSMSGNTFQIVNVVYILSSQDPI